MVRFSCFNGHINTNKPKCVKQKTGHSFVEAMNMFQGSSRSQALEKSLDAKTFLDVPQGGDATDSHYNEDLPCIEQGWRSDEMESKLSVNDEAASHQNGGLKKSKSESGLHMKGKVSGDEDTDDDETDKGFSVDNSNDNTRFMLPDGGNDPGLSPSSKYQKDKSIFSIEDLQNSDKGVPENSDADPSSGRHAGNSGDQTPRTPPSISRSNSLPNIATLVLASEENSVKHLARHWRSSDDLHILDKRQSQIPLHELKLHITPEEETAYTAHQLGDRYEDPVDYDNDNFNYESSARGWIVPVMGEHPLDSHEEESAAHPWNEVPSKDFKIKRIEDWVFDLEPCSPLEETNGLSELSNEKKRESTAVNGSSSKVIPGMEAAKRYISSLNPTATTAQLSNHGLAVIPFVSAFVSLKVLNLSGNAIVRITAGALPRGLHALNLSKNHISVIEGLRELTRLRVLDLSYNRIFRIGHGLASCSSLKELYLAGNKISEVEGLHRLLKLNILDLRFNKISTAKCLGQLAANYNSLQAISLEGNPAQKNVGDEQLKKYLQGLLPQLAYYNRQFIKVRAKDGGERSVRLALGGSHQFDRGNRSDYKSTRKSSHGISSKVASSSSHGRRSQAADSPRRSKTKHVRLPPSTTGTKAAGHHHHHGEKLRTLKPESIRQSRSMGTLGTP